MDSIHHGPYNPLAHSQRLSITLSQHVFDALLQRSQLQGRSMSNLAAYLLECAVHEGNWCQP